MREIVTVREHLELQIRQERELREAHERAIDYRLEQMNELREQINRERGTFVLRETNDSKQDLLTRRQTENEQKLSNIATARSTLSWLWGATLGAAGLLIAILHWLSSWHTVQH
jgi:hypothetical protein